LTKLVPITASMVLLAGPAFAADDSNVVQTPQTESSSSEVRPLPPIGESTDSTQSGDAAGFETPAADSSSSEVRDLEPIGNEEPKMDEEAGAAAFETPAAGSSSSEVRPLEPLGDEEKASN